MGKLKHLVLTIFITILAIIMLEIFNFVNAESTSPIYLGIVSLRSSGYGYRQAGKQVWKIAQYDSKDDTTADLSKNIYCIKAGPGFGSTDMSSGGKQTISTYNQRFNLRDLSAIENPYNTALPTGENYNKLLWLLDHFYIIPTTDNKEERDEFLKNIIPNEEYGLLTNDDIDVVQQLAIWYFTNQGTEYQYEDIQLYRNTLVNVDGDYKTLFDLLGEEGQKEQDAALSLYKYYITNADGSYTSSNVTTTPIEFIKDNASMQKNGDNYIAGPYKINQSLNIDFELDASFTDMNNNTIEPILAIKNEDGSFEEFGNDYKKLKELIGTDFYLIMPVNSEITGIKSIIKSYYKSRTLTFWSAENSPNNEQPVVIVEDTPYTFADEASIAIQRPFDLSLRKFITQVNGVDVPSRAPEVDVSKLKDGTSTTAIYNHTKKPVKVSIGDVITYTIRVYNEGSQNGYATEITDHLPKGLEFIVDDEINIQYGWKLASSSDLKTVTTKYLSKENETTNGANLINGFSGDTLNYKEVQIRCRVIKEDETETLNKITNIAEITAFADENGAQISDIDSQAKNLNMPSSDMDLQNYKDAEINRGEEYIEGQQDDDDFEKLILKEFDLALRKFVTGVNGQSITDRQPNVDLSRLIEGTSTTAIYNHTKAPLKVSIGDEVEYTIRVYNEGEMDGYASQITDYLPDGLEFIIDNETNMKYGWVQDTENPKIVRTNYLSKENEKTANENKLVAFDGTTLSYKDIKIVCRVVLIDPMPNKITNIVDISQITDSNMNTVTDRDSTVNNMQIPADLPGYRDDELNKNYIPGQEDDDDFEKLMLKEFDLSLRKFITGVNDEDITNRQPNVDVSGLNAGTATTATYNHIKTPVAIEIGDTIKYTIRVYNEGDVSGYASQITDYLPDGLEFISDNEINMKYGWVQDTENPKIIRTNYLSKENSEENLIPAFDGTNISSKDIEIVCRVVNVEPMPTKITNIAEISGFTNENGENVQDRDSIANNVEIPADLPEYKNDELSKDYIPGQQDDDDFEKLTLKSFDLSLRKYISKINNNNVTSRIPQVDISGLRDGSSTTAIYNHSKEPVEVTLGSTVEYTLRVYNEGEIDGFATEITDYIPEQLEFLPENSINQEYGWIMVDANGNQTENVSDAIAIKTNYLSQEKENSQGQNLIPAFDGTTLSYKDVKVVFKVVRKETMPEKITNIAEITDCKDINGNSLPDRDSEKNNVQIPENLSDYKDDEIANDYIPGQQDDDDFEKVTIVEFDLSLRKFINAVNGTQITNREPQVDITPLINASGTTAIYNHSKEPVLVTNGNTVTYTIRVYNEGEVSGYASLIKDDIPEGLEFLPENEVNIQYRWIMLDENGNKTEDKDKAVAIQTDYLSKENEKESGENLILAFDKENISYKDVKVTFTVKEPTTSDKIIINKAQIAEDTDKDGNEVEDKDSVQNVWNEGEDDQDIEKVKVQYFDLSLKKWVTEAIVIENGNQTVTQTGHTADDNPESIVSVSLKDNNVDNIVVKFKYKIRVSNEGNIAGYAKEIKDYIPEGLIFEEEDNPLWTKLDDKTIITTQTQDILLEPGETTEVEVTLTWDKQNFGVMDNIAEISKDDNDFDSPDKDSTPDNNVQGEDDIDDARVMLTVKTGQIVIYIAISMTVLIVILGGILLIKKFVL